MRLRRSEATVIEHAHPQGDSSPIQDSQIKKDPLSYDKIVQKRVEPHTDSGASR